VESTYESAQFGVEQLAGAVDVLVGLFVVLHVEVEDRLEEGPIGLQEERRKNEKRRKNEAKNEVVSQPFRCDNVGGGRKKGGGQRTLVSGMTVMYSSMFFHSFRFHAAPAARGAIRWRRGLSALGQMSSASRVSSCASSLVRNEPFKLNK
jgi:hypothetical protein